MPTRELRSTSDFKKSLTNLARKYPGITDSVDSVLEQCVRRGAAPQSMQIPGLQGLPVFKERIPIGNKGKRAGARIIYYCDSDFVIALFIFAKNTKEDIAPAVIRDALGDAGLVNGAKGSDQTENNGDYLDELTPAGSLALVVVFPLFTEPPALGAVESGVEVAVLPGAGVEAGEGWVSNER